MATQAILITYRDMVPEVSELIKKANDKYNNGRFRQLYFDDGFSMSESLWGRVDHISDEDKLKIYISGHGGTGIQYITANDGVRKQTVDNLASLLEYALKDRARSWEGSANTEVNMVCCLFGRTPDGGLDGCPAVCLHRKLAAKKVYVDLVARTEAVAARATGRKTISPLERDIDRLKYDVKGWARRKTQFTKIRCTYESGAPVVRIRDYEGGDEVYINSDSLEGRRILWADNVVNKLVEHITPPGRQTEVTDDRHKKVYDTVKWYSVWNDPVGLEKRLEDLVDPEKTDFTTHRNILHVPFRLPKTAGLIADLLRAYPRSSTP